jgi:hypothetical protein
MLLIMARSLAHVVGKGKNLTPSPALPLDVFRGGQVAPLIP